MAGRPFRERKIKPDGTVREYGCTWLHRAPGLAVARFVMPEGSGAFATPIPLPPGTTSDGYFWTARPYSVYRMSLPGGGIVAHRFDAVTDVVIDDAGVRYRDLVLDWWVLPDGTVIEEDVQELAELVAAGVVSNDDKRRAGAAGLHILSRYRHIIDGLATLERRIAR